MKLVSTFKKITVLSIAAMMLQTSVSAATFVAAISGNFSSTATWVGGIVPTIMVSADEIVIPTGIKVTLDQNLQLSGTAELTVDGSLTNASGYYLAITGGTINGSGTITLDSMHTDITAGFDFDGALDVGMLTSEDAVLDGTANVTINEMLILKGGVFQLNSSTLTMNPSSVIVFENNSTIAAGSSSVNLTNKYHVIYRSGSYTSGLELSGTGLADVEVNVGASEGLTLGGDLMMNGTLLLNTGRFNLNNRNLTFGANGNFSPSGNGVISSSSNSDITVNSTNGLTGALRFSAVANTVDDLTISTGTTTAVVTLGGNLDITGQLSLQSGRLNIGGNKLTLGTGATVVGGSSNSYVVTDDGGRLSLSIDPNSSHTFHVGTTDDYAPAIITAAGTSASTNISVGVAPDVKTSGNTGADESITQPLIDATWFVESSVLSNVNVDMELLWSTNMEANGFNRSKAYISHYTNGSWDASAMAAANINGNGMYSVKRTGITSFSPFAVFEENTAVSVHNVVAENGSINIYPNPANGVIQVQYKGNAQPLRAEIYSVAGQLVSSVTITGAQTSIDVSKLAEGMYYLQLKGDGINATEKFVKQ